jgi:exopolyphosphatase/guanosine-5'-triphosphate,3'-diphosphate pyrophosphatase
MKKAAIDIGTNTVILIAGEVVKGQLKVEYGMDRTPRIGQGVGDSGKISSQNIDKVIEVVQEYQFLLKSEYPVDEVILYATSAVRQASNQTAFIEKVKRFTGLDVHILTEEQESELMYYGVMHELPEYEHPVSVLEIGGGVTHLAYGKYGYVIKTQSYKLGSVRYTEKFITSDPPSEEDILRLREQVRADLAKTNFAIQDKKLLVGSSGTAVSAAYILQELKEFSFEKINGYRIKKSQLESLIDQYTGESAEVFETKNYPMLRGRGDIVFTGFVILDEFMAYYNFDTMMVSSGAIRHGVMLRYPRKI